MFGVTPNDILLNSLEALENVKSELTLTEHLVLIESIIRCVHEIWRLDLTDRLLVLKQLPDYLLQIV